MSLKSPIGEIVLVVLGPARDDGPYPGLTMAERDDGARDLAVFVPRFSMPLYKHKVRRDETGMGKAGWPCWRTITPG